MKRRVLARAVCAMAGVAAAAARQPGQTAAWSDSRAVESLRHLTVTVAVDSLSWRYARDSHRCALLRRSRGWAAISILFSLWVLYGAGIEAGGLGIVLILLGLPLYYATRRFSSAAASG